MKFASVIIAAAIAAALLIAGCISAPNLPPAPPGNGTPQTKEAGFCSNGTDCKYYWYAGGCYTPENMEQIQAENVRLGLHPAEAQEIPGASCTCEKNVCKMIMPPANSTLPTQPADGMTKELCESARGFWNECASACRGAPEGTACTLQCVQQCECGGFAGFDCPQGYACTDYLPKGAADAMGVCKNQ